ncbi:MAG: hypothetical protein DHS20C21_10950 [Gemmatimonadota bacterium]|nr:MAG: hypothetical protein DHS20C21_10950 [Gemmatimonadota bacterium]
MERRGQHEPEWERLGRLAQTDPLGSQAAGHQRVVALSDEPERVPAALNQHASIVAPSFPGDDPFPSGAVSANLPRRNVAGSAALPSER